MAQFSDWIIRYPGIPPEILITYGDLIQKMVKEYNLTPMSKIDSVRTRVMFNPQPEPPGDINIRRSPMPATLNNSIDWWWKYGGIRAPHFHYGEDVYALDQRQWQEFSATVMKDISTKLTHAKSIGFDQFVNVANAVNEIG